MRTWLRQHREALARARGRLGAQRMATLLNALVIGVALSLPAGGYVVLSGLQGVAQRVSYEPQVSVFLRPGAGREEVEARLRKDARVAGLRFVSRDEALAELRVAEDLADVIAELERNPLPDAFVVRGADPSPAALEALAAGVRALPGVARVQVDSAWAQRLAALVRTGRLALGALAVVLATGLVAVTFNTIRLQILTQREEIEVSRLLAPPTRSCAARSSTWASCRAWPAGRSGWRSLPAPSRCSMWACGTSRRRTARASACLSCLGPTRSRSSPSRDF